MEVTKIIQYLRNVDWDEFQDKLAASIMISVGILFGIAVLLGYIYMWIVAWPLALIVGVCVSFGWAALRLGV